MVKDRLPELKKIQEDMSNTEEGSYSSVKETEETYFCPLDKKCAELGQLLRSIGLLQENISSLKEQVNYAKNLQDQIEKSLFGVCQEKSQLKSTVDKINAHVSYIQGQLNKLFQSAESDDHLSIKHRVKISHHKALSKGFLKIIDDFHISQEQHANLIKCRLQRHLSILGEHSVSEERLESMMTADTEESIQHITYLHDARQKYSAVSERHEQIKTLGKGIREVHTMFMDMHCLLMNQSELVDTIEYNVLQTKDYVESAKISLDLTGPRNLDLKKAFPCKKKYSTKKYMKIPISLFKSLHCKLSK